MSYISRAKGFTLIELLVVVSIVGVIILIALGNFTTYREKGGDGAAKSDLRNAATSQETYFVDHDVYVSCTSASDCESILTGFQGTSDVVLNMTAFSDYFTGTSVSTTGSGKTFNWNSQDTSEILN